MRTFGMSEVDRDDISREYLTDREIHAVCSEIHAEYMEVMTEELTDPASDFFEDLNSEFDDWVQELQQRLKFEE